MKTNAEIKRMIRAALFLALAFVIPFLTGQIPKFGAMLCPMHIPVLLCGFICGGPWGAVVGLVAPIVRSLILSMPPLFPTAVCMAAELCAYGLVSGLMHKFLPRKKMSIYLSLLVAMIAGRAVWGAAMLACLGTGGFTFAAFIAGAFTGAIPGIIVQIILIPPLAMIFESKKS